MSRRQVVLLGLGFLVLDLVFLRWVLAHFENWGFWDWDYQQTLLEVSRHSLLEHHQLPLWNPFIGGGATLAGNTLNHAWAPCFLPILLFGTITGVKVCILLYLGIAQLGMFRLARHHGLGAEGSILAALIFSIGGVFAHRLTHGHFEWIAIAWAPFVVLAIDRAVTGLDRRSICWGGVCFAFLFLDGGPYQFAMLSAFVGLYALARALESRTARPLLALAAILALGIGLGAIKLLPVLETVFRYPRETVEANFYGAPFTPTAMEILHQMLVARSQAHDPEAWMPYILNVGCYVGWVPLLLALGAAVAQPRRNALLTLFALGFSWIALGPAAPLDVWELLHRLPGFSMLRVPSRFNVVVLLCLGLLAGSGLDLLRRQWVKRERWTRPAAWALLALVAADLSAVNGEIFKVAFSIPPLHLTEHPEMTHYWRSPYLQVYRRRALYPTFPNWPSAVYPAVLENRGVIATFQTIPFRPHALPFSHPLYRGEAWFREPGLEIRSLRVTPNRVRAETGGKAGTLVFNTNFDAGWIVRGKSDLAPFSEGGLLAVKLPPGVRVVELAYRPTVFLVGSAISGLTWLIVVGVLFLPARYWPGRCVGE